jgi:hypothetical protein
LEGFPVPVLVTRDGIRFNLQSGKATIGRSSENDIALAHRSVSRRHAVIQAEAHHLFLKDLSSSNGTWVGNRRIGKVQLADGDVVRFGEVELSFIDGDSAAASGKKFGQGAAESIPSRRSGESSHRISRRVKSVAAIAVVIILGFGATELVIGRSSGSVRGAAGSSGAVTTAPASDTSASYDTGAASSGGVAAAEVGNAVIETGRKHAGDNSWVAVDPTAAMCERGAIPADSILCRVAYLGRHAEGRDLERGPQGSVVAAADVAEMCKQGAIEPASSVCAKTGAGRASRFWP